MGPSIADLRDAYTTEFPKATGIQLEYRPAPNASVVAAREVSTGSPTFDILQSGGAPLDDLEPNGQLQPVKPLLLLPEVTDPTAWRGDNGVLYMDKNAQDMPRPTSSLSPLLFINTDLVQPGTVKSGKDLLDPKWKGKIVATDPRVGGPGAATGAYLDETFGPDFINALYNGQNTVLVPQDRQAAEEVARGRYAFGVGVSSQSGEAYRKEGLPIMADLPPESPGHLGGGFAPMVIVKAAPHPNAAAVFANWVLSKAGQTAYSQAVLEVSERKDVATGKIPDYRVPKDSVKYVDTYENGYYTNKRSRLSAEIKGILK
jgi:ABC-type Fe3+ transport system substrate-binding protein